MQYTPSKKPLSPSSPCATNHHFQPFICKHSLPLSHLSACLYVCLYHFLSSWTTCSDHAAPPVPHAHPGTQILSINSSQFKKWSKETGLPCQQGHVESPAYPHRSLLLLYEVLAFPQRSAGKTITGELFNCLTWIADSKPPAHSSSYNLLASHQGRPLCHFQHYHCTLPASRSPPVLGQSASW